MSCGMMECLLKVINWYGDGQEHITVSKTDSLYICSFFSVQERQCQEKKMYLLNCDHGWLFSSYKTTLILFSNGQKHQCL